MRPASPPFITCRASPSEARVLLFGIPFEGTVNLRKGAHRGPGEIRIASDSIETYSPTLGQDLEDLALADLGDCEVPGGSPREALAAVREEIRGFWSPATPTVMLGGDHMATFPLIEVLASRLTDLHVLQLDAHPDIREEFLGERYCYASAMARIMEVIPPERVWQVGMRTGSREEFERRHPNFHPATISPPLQAVKSILPSLLSHPLYVTIDIDLLDPSEAPGTGSPEPGGLRVPELVEILRLLGGCAVAGIDLVEVAHAHDPSGRTGIAASWILREAILTFWGK